MLKYKRLTGSFGGSLRGSFCGGSRGYFRGSLWGNFRGGSRGGSCGTVVRVTCLVLFPISGSTVLLRV